MKIQVIIQTVILSMLAWGISVNEHVDKIHIDSRKKTNPIVCINKVGVLFLLFQKVEFKGVTKGSYDFCSLHQ